jgi:hypothetical protein
MPKEVAKEIQMIANKTHKISEAAGIGETSSGHGSDHLKNHMQQNKQNAACAFGAAWRAVKSELNQICNSAKGRPPGYFCTFALRGKTDTSRRSPNNGFFLSD